MEQKSTIDMQIFAPIKMALKGAKIVSKAATPTTSSAICPDYWTDNINSRRDVGKFKSLLWVPTQLTLFQAGMRPTKHSGSS